MISLLSAHSPILRIMPQYKTIHECTIQLSVLRFLGVNTTIFAEKHGADPVNMSIAMEIHKYSITIFAVVSNVFAIFPTPHDVRFGIAGRLASQTDIGRLQYNHIAAGFAIHDAGRHWKGTIKLG